MYCQLSMPAIARQEKLCREFAEENNLEVLKVYADLGTNDDPHLRVYFMQMSDFARTYNEPLIVLMEDYSRISRKMDELKTHFQILHDVHGAEIIDVRTANGKYSHDRAITEARTHEVLMNVAAMLQQNCDTSEKLFHQVADLLEERGNL